MAFVPDYAHDVFVSYAHVDDMSFPGVEKGWVTTLIETLEVLLAQKLGRREGYSLWMDHQLSRHVDLTPEILANLGKTATLLIVLSPGYLASEWCLREKDTFLELLGDKRRSGSRIFILERDKVDPNERPPQFADLLGYRFWVQEGAGDPPRILGSPWPDPKNAENMAYFDQLTRLAANLADELKALKESAAPAAAGTPSAADGKSAEGRPTVFLAEVTDDLDAESDALKRYLEQAGLSVLPETFYSRDPQKFQRQVDADLAASTLFVQLLSALPGKRPPGLPRGYIHTQYERAVAAGLPVIQWRSRDLDPAAVADEEHRAFLELETVMAVGSEELKRTVAERAVPPPAAAAAAATEAATDALVFINAEAGDLELAEAVGELLDRRGVAYAMPLASGSPVEVREDFEQNLMFADALVLVYGTIGAKWVRDQLLVLRKLASKRDAPLRALAVLEGPPEPKEPVRLALPGLITLDGRRGLDEAVLEPFFAALAEGS